MMVCCTRPSSSHCSVLATQCNGRRHRVRLPSPATWIHTHRPEPIRRHRPEHNTLRAWRRRYMGWDLSTPHHAPAADLHERRSSLEPSVGTRTCSGAGRDGDCMELCLSTGCTYLTQQSTDFIRHCLQGIWWLGNRRVRRQSSRKVGLGIPEGADEEMDLLCLVRDSVAPQVSLSR